MLNKPYPDNLSTIRICRSCNSRFSPDEEYVAAVLGTLLFDEKDPENSAQKLNVILESNHLLQDLLEDCLEIESETEGVAVALRPDPARMEQVVVKNARGHLHQVMNVEQMGEPDHVTICPADALPVPAAPLFSHSADWGVVQPEVYRFSVLADGDLTVRSVIREYLLTEVIWVR